MAQEKQEKEAQLEQVNQRITNIESEGGTQIERENEIDRLKRQKTKIERDIEEAKKTYKKPRKNLEEAAKEVELLQRILADKEQKRNAIKARHDRTKPLDELEEQKATLKRQIEEDKRVIEDENTSPGEREAAEARNEEREEELARLDPQIQEREEALPLRERVKNVFKKLGYTLQAVIIAAGLVIGTASLKAMNALKAGTKAVGNTLKAIGTIVSFIFKTAGQVVSFLGKNAWLLILALVAFLIERLTKKRQG